jgi:hypothetical protein
MKTRDHLHPPVILPNVKCSQADPRACLNVMAKRKISICDGNQTSIQPVKYTYVGRYIAYAACTEFSNDFVPDPFRAIRSHVKIQH